jgi:hypothetical protein
MTADAHKLGRKARLDALLLKLPGVSTRTINGFDAYFVRTGCSRASAAPASACACPSRWRRDLQLSRATSRRFRPAGSRARGNGSRSTAADADEYEKDLALFQASIEFVTGRR